MYVLYVCICLLYHNGFMDVCMNECAVSLQCKIAVQRVCVCTVCTVCMYVLYVYFTIMGVCMYVCMNEYAACICHYSVKSQLACVCMYVCMYECYIV